MLDDLLFASPPREFRPVPMWFWNGDLDEAEVRRQVQAFAAGGLGGFQIAARTCLTTPYLSQRWFDLVNLAGKEAERHGLQVWLADEYPYPSGASGGELTVRHPEYRAWHMRAISRTVRPGERVACQAPGTVLLCAAAAPVVDGAADWSRVRNLEAAVGITQPELVFTEPAFGLSKKRTFSFGPRPKLDWTAPDAAGVVEWQIWLVAAAEVSPYKFFGYYVDLCNPDAVRAFLDTTYQRYADRLDPALWRQLSGFFLDESHPPSWSWSLPDAFVRRNGYDLVPFLPALWTDVGPRTATVRHDYWQTVTELFLDSFHKPVAEWCRAHDVQLSLEVDSTRNLVQRYAHIAGNDPGHEKVGGTLDELQAEARPRFRAHPRFPASLAAQVGLRRVLVESYHSIGWSLTLQDMKALADRLAAQGANLFVFHAFLYSLGGLRKWDAPPSQFFQNPYWPYFPHFTAYLGRLCYALSQGRRASPVAVVDPITSLWTHGSGAGGSIGSGPDAVARRIAADWQYLLRELEAGQRPFDSLDPLLLGEGRVEGGTLRLGEAAYSVIVLPPMASLEAAAWAKLEEFAAGGVTVVACGLLPYEQIEPGSTVVERCADRFAVKTAAVQLAYEGARQDGERPVTIRRNGPYILLHSSGTLKQVQAAPALLTLLDELSPAEVVIEPVAGADARRSFLVAQRRDAEEALYFIANAGNEEQDCDVTLRVPVARGAGGELMIERLDLEDGTRNLLGRLGGEQVQGSGSHTVRLRFPRYGSHMLLVRHAGAAAEAAPPPQDVAPDVAIALDGDWHCTLVGDNALRLDRFRFGVVVEPSPTGDAPPVSSAEWPLIETKPLVNVLRDLEQAGRSWPLPVRVETPFGSPARLQPSLPATAWYEATFDVAALPERAALCLEAPALQGEWALWLNGQPVPSGAFTPRFRWDVTNREVDVRSLLRRGRNTLTVRVALRHQTDGLVDPLYLLGDFGVTVAGAAPTIGAVPRRVHWERRPSDGLPYYAGVLRLRKTVALSGVAGERVALRLPDDACMYAGVVELAVNGHQLGSRLWAPYRWEIAGSQLRPGENDIAVTITVPLAGLLEGKRYDPVRRDAVGVQEGE